MILDSVAVVKVVGQAGISYWSTNATGCWPGSLGQVIDTPTAGDDFVARFASPCNFCGDTISTGDTATRLNDHLYICTACSAIAGQR